MICGVSEQRTINKHKRLVVKAVTTTLCVVAKPTNPYSCDKYLRGTDFHNDLAGLLV